MRIISGKYRGKKLLTVDKATLRPTTDRTKEAIFNLLQNKIQGRIALDLFCGSGALGIEALSRGAMKVIFNDNDNDAIKVVKKNLNSFVVKNFDIYNLEYLSCLQRLRGTKYDLVFLDPPYENQTAYQIAINFLLDNNMLKQNAYLICESNQDITYDDNRLVEWKKRKYSRNIITIFTINN